MASLSTTTTLFPRTSLFPFSQKSPQIPSFKNTTKHCSARRVRLVSCNATVNEDQQPPPGNLDRRRNVLIGLGGLYGGLSSLPTDPFAFANPISPPDLTQCGPADLPSGALPTNCCPPTSPKIIDLKLPPPPSRLRVRPAAQTVDQSYIDKYSKAIALMKALPDDDPRNFTQQANVHCAYCDGAYDQVGFPDLELQIHNCWLFFPFHRYYLYVHSQMVRATSIPRRSPFKILSGSWCLTRSIWWRNEGEFRAGSLGSFGGTSAGKHNFPASSGWPRG